MLIRDLRSVEEFEKVPLPDRCLPESTYEMIRHGAGLGPKNDALIFFLQGRRFKRGVHFSYGDFLQRVTQAANLFHRLGVGKTGVVSYVLPNLPETLFSLWGAEAAGIANPINPLLEADQIAAIMRTAESQVLVTLAPFPGVDIWEKVEAARRSVATLETILTVDLTAYLPPVKRAVVKSLNLKGARTKRFRRQQVLNFRRELARCSGESLESRRRIEGQDVASYFHTGGTTGRPRLALHTHANEVANGWIAAQIAAIKPGLAAFCGLPYFHVNAATLTGLAELGSGATVVLGSPSGYRDPEIVREFWKIVEHYRICIMSAVPTVYAKLLQVPVGNSDISSLDFPLCGAAPMPVDIFRSFEAHTGLRILEGYGLTEATCFSSVNPVAGERRPGSIGLRIPYCEMKPVILNSVGDYVRDCGVGECGVIAIRGPYVFPGYKQGSSRDNVWVDIRDGRGRWLNTGDLGKMDADGYFWLTGRQKELIIRGGHNIDPAAIEEPLLEHRCVALAAAVGRPDPDVGEVPVAYVQLHEDMTTTPDELMEFIRPRLGEQAALPKAIRIIDALPLTAIGKIFRPRLCGMEIEDVFREELGKIGGIGNLRVGVDVDAERGILAVVEFSLKPGSDPERLREQIRGILKPYPIPNKIVFQ